MVNTMLQLAGTVLHITLKAIVIILKEVIVASGLIVKAILGMIL